MEEHLDLLLVIISLHELILADHFRRLCLVVSVVSGRWQTAEISLRCVGTAKQLCICALVATSLGNSRPGCVSNWIT